MLLVSSMKVSLSPSTSGLPKNEDLTFLSLVNFGLASSMVPGATLLIGELCNGYQVASRSVPVSPISTSLFFCSDSPSKGMACFLVNGGCSMGATCFGDSAMGGSDKFEI